VRGRVVIEAVGTTARPGGTVRVRSGLHDLGEVAIVDGVASFSTVAPDVAGTIAITASYAGDGAFSPAVDTSCSPRSAPLTDSCSLSR